MHQAKYDRASRKAAAREHKQPRIFYPNDSWLAIQNQVFTEVFPSLRERRARHLYLAMYERARQMRSREFAANLRGLSELIRCDPRTAKNCIDELRRLDFVKMVHKGGAWRSRTDKPRFRVPLSELDLANGGWVPIPRLLLDPYMITVPSSLLLIVVIYFNIFPGEMIVGSV